jgi:quercetin dioxygenase-like cupin family protein
VVATLVLAGPIASGQSVKPDAGGFIAAQPEELRPAEGMQQIVILGDPTKPGMYVVRDVFAPHRVNRPHFHSQDRYVTVLKGTWWVALGTDADSGDPAKMVAMKPGSFVFHPANGHHFDGTKDEEVTVQIVGMGPVMTSQVAPAAK